MASSKALSGLDPLKDLLGDVLARIEALEMKAGVVPASSASSARSPAVPVKATYHGRFKNAGGNSSGQFVRVLTID
jgi:hypothetical protein